MADRVVIAVDPGREKCGIAAVDQRRGVLIRQVIATSSLAEMVQEWAKMYHTTVVVLGSRTSSKEARQKLQGLMTDAGPLSVVMVEEHRSTEEARLRFWQESPPRGLWRLVPTGMRTPPAPVDDLVAVILAERYFARQK